MQNQRKDKQQLMAYFSMKTDQQQTAICNITGIRITISAPQIKSYKGQILEYQNPLAIYNNAKDFAKQGFMQSHNFTDTTVLAGCLLTLLHYGKLRHDKLSAAEANMYLSQLTKVELSRTLHFVANLSHFECQRIPKLSLSESDSRSLINWAIAAQEKLVAKPDIEEIAKKVTVKSESSKATVSVELRKKARALLGYLKENKLVNTSFASILTLSIQGNNIATIHKELREKLILGLQKIDIPQAIELASVFETAGKKMKQYHENLDKEIENLSISKTVNVQTPANKLSVIELLQLQMSGKATVKVEPQNKTAEDDIEAEFLAKQNSNQPKQNQQNKQNKQNKQNSEQQSEQNKQQTRELVGLLKELNSEIEQERAEDSEYTDEILSLDEQYNEEHLNFGDEDEGNEDD